jgi:hypothetical protein
MHGRDSDGHEALRNGSDVVIVNRSVRPGAEPRVPRVEVRVARHRQHRRPLDLFAAQGAYLRPRYGQVAALRFGIERDAPPGMGIRFDHLSAEDTGRIYEFSPTRAPRFIDDEPRDVALRTTLRP